MELKPAVTEEFQQPKAGSEEYIRNLGRRTFNMKLLIKLYLLADTLIDPVTANLTIDELIRQVSVNQVVIGPDEVNLVYSSTASDCPLRAYIVEWFLHPINFEANELLLDAELTHELKNEIAVEVRHKNWVGRNRSILQVYDMKWLSCPDGHYHRETD